MPNKIQSSMYAMSIHETVITEGTAYKTDSDGSLHVFHLEHDENGQWLNDNNGKPDNFWNGNNRWVFCRQSLH